jgi:hypothetical protein
MNAPLPRESYRAREGESRNEVDVRNGKLERAEAKLAAQRPTDSNWRAAPLPKTQSFASDDVMENLERRREAKSRRKSKQILCF